MPLGLQGGLCLCPGLKGLRALMSIRTTRDTPLPEALPEAKHLDYRGVWMLILACNLLPISALRCPFLAPHSPAPLPEPLSALPTHDGVVRKLNLGFFPPNHVEEKGCKGGKGKDKWLFVNQGTFCGLGLDLTGSVGSCPCRG